MSAAVGETSAAPGAVRRAPDASRRRLVAAAAVVALAGLGLRIGILASSLGALDSDEAIVGLMARRLLDGTFNAFYTGQAYGGSQEAVLAAAAFWVAGSTVAVLKLVVVALTIATVVLTWRVGRRTVGDRAALLAAALLWVGPPFAVWWSTKARGFYGVSTTMALLAILAALRLLDRPSRLDAAVLGLAAGVGWWASPQSAVVAGAAVLVALALRPALVRLAPLATATALVGAAPWLVFNLRNDWVSLDTPPIPTDVSAQERFQGLFTEALPRFFGFRDYLGGDWWLPPLGQVAYLGLCAALLVWAVRAVQARDRRRLLVAPLVAFPVYFAVNPFTAFPEARYVWIVAPILLLAVADVAVRTAARVGRPRLAPAVVPLVAVATALAMVDLADDATGAWDIVAGDADPLVEALLARGFEHAHADYWVAYKLSFESEERLIATGVPYYRGLADMAAVGADPRPAYVTFAGDPVADRIEAALAAEGIGAERLVVEPWEAVLPRADVPAPLRSEAFRS